MMVLFQDLIFKCIQINQDQELSGFVYFQFLFWDLGVAGNLFDIYVRHYECVDSSNVKSDIFKTFIQLELANNYDGETVTVQAYEENLDFSSGQD